MTVTGMPRSANSSAVVQPTGPAPTTMTFWGYMACGLSGSRQGGDGEGEPGDGRADLLPDGAGDGDDEAAVLAARADAAGRDSGVRPPVGGRAGRGGGG